MSSIDLHAFGWDSFFEDRFERHRESGLVPARVAVEHRGAYEILTQFGELRAEATGRLLHEASSLGDLPAVGDWVAASPRPGEGVASIHTVLPRKTKFARKVAGEVTDEQVVAANVDVVFLVVALTGDFNVRRLERYLATAYASGARPVVVLTKADLCLDVDACVLEAEAVAVEVPVHVVSGVTGRGFDALRTHLGAGRTAALLGSSGVGKSTIVNRLLDHGVQRIRDVRNDGRGRHTTTHRALFALPGGGLVLDTPGMRELQLWTSAAGMDDAFSDVAALATGCRFRDCRHEREPGCAVLAAVAGGVLEYGRLKSYRKLQRELAFLARKQDKRARAEETRKYKVMHKAMRSRMR